MFKILLSCNKVPYLFSINNVYYFSTNAKQAKRDFMQPVRTKFIIKQKQKINHDCYVFKFNFNGPKFPLKIGHHFRIIQNTPTLQHPEGQDLMRYYTPISSCNDFQNDKIDVLIKIYRPNQDPLYPMGGKLTPYLQTLRSGDELDIQGPFSKFTYQSPGKIQICKNIYSKTKTIHDVKRIFFIAGGTGITPIYQTITQIAKRASDKTQIILLFCNKTEKDIILRKQLQSLQPRLNLHHILQIPPEGWNGLTGRINADVLNKLCPLDDSETFYLYCGPKGMNMALSKIFQRDYPKSNHFKI